MSGELAFSLGAFLCVVALLLCVVALLWKAFRRLDDRLDEIQADIADLIAGVRGDAGRSIGARMARRARYEAPGVAPSPGAVPFKAEPNLASASAEDAPAEHARERKSSRGLEAELIEVDELCAKLITLAPPETALPLLKENTPEKPVEPVGGRKPLLAWPPQEPYKEPARTDSKPRPEIPIRRLTTYE
jgi:hypothetical protein